MVLPWLVAAWLAGIAAAPALHLVEWQWAALALLAGLAALATRREPRIGLSFLAVAGLCLGALRLQAADRWLAAAPIASRAPSDGVIDLEGVVLTPPGRWGESYAFDLASRQLSEPERGDFLATRGRVRVVSSAAFATARGEHVVVRGRLRRATPHDGPGAAAVIEAASARRLAPAPRLNPLAMLDAARLRIVERLGQVLPAAEASLVAGVLLGADESMPEAIQEAFRITGTAHILAVSGFNVTIVAAAAMTVFGSILGTRRGSVAAGAAVVLYTLLCGAEPAVVRAALMACIALLALRLGRQSAALASLAAAALLMTLVDPRVLFDVGFQLSFLATLGLVLAGRPSQEAIRRWGEKAIPDERARSAFVVVAEVTALSLIAQAATLPLSAEVFHRLPLVSLPANTLILPAQPLLMATGAIAAAAASLDLRLGAGLAWLAWPPAAYTLRVTEFFAGLPGAAIHLDPFPPGASLLIYAVVGLLFLAGRWPKLRAGAESVVRFGGPAWLIGLAALTTLAWRAAVERPDGRLHVTAFPGGDVLIQSPTGRFIAVTVGPSPGGLRQSLDDWLPLTHPELDWLILTDPESSAGAAVDALGRHRPSGIIIAGGAGADVASPADERTRMVPGVDGLALDLGEQARLEIIDLGPSRSALRLAYGSAVVLLSSEAVGGSQTPVGTTPAQALVLLGEGRNVGQAIERAGSAPGAAVVVAAPLPGEPFPSLAERGSSASVVATPWNGWIRLSSDGARLWVEVERPP